MYGKFKHIIFAFSLIILILLSGIIGFMILDERYTFTEALYMTIITVTTVGFSEVHDLNESGMLFTSTLILVSFGTFAYTISVISAYIISGEFRTYFKLFKVKNDLSKMSQHVIICGFGRNGQQAAVVLKSKSQAFVVIEKDKDLTAKKINTPNEIYIAGDATDDDILEQAGISRASALITTLPNDAQNLFVVLTAREKNKSLKIISRASEDTSDKKLRIAGADNVIMPDKIGGAHMASLVTKPDVMEFMDYVSSESNMGFNLEEISFDQLPENLRNKSIHEIFSSQNIDINVIGMKNAGGEFFVNPSPDCKIINGSKLFVLGTALQINKVKSMFA